MNNLASTIGLNWIWKLCSKKCLNLAVKLVVLYVVVLTNKPKAKCRTETLRLSWWQGFCHTGENSKGNLNESHRFCVREKVSFLSEVLIYKWGGPKNTGRLVAFWQLQRPECPGIQFILFLFISTMVYIVLWRTYLYSCFQPGCSGHSMCACMRVCGDVLSIMIIIAYRVITILSNFYCTYFCLYYLVHSWLFITLYHFPSLVCACYSVCAKASHCELIKLKRLMNLILIFEWHELEDSAEAFRTSCLYICILYIAVRHDTEWNLSGWDVNDLAGLRRGLANWVVVRQSLEPDSSKK